MKKNKLVMGLSLTILVGLWGGGVAQAASPNASPQAQNKPGASSQVPRGPRDPAQSQNKRQILPNSARKAAAKRLRVVNQQKHQQKLNNWAKAHQGYTGLGKAKNSPSNTQKPSVKGGVI